MEETDNNQSPRVQSIIGLTVLTLCCIVVTRNSEAQLVDSSSVVLSVAQAEEEYHYHFSYPILLHTGPEYVEVDRNAQGSPYFLSEDYSYGNVVIDGHRFDSVMMRYDVENDKISIEHYTGRNFYEQLELIPQKVDSFSLHDHQFFRVNKKQPNLSVGFYDLLYSGNVKVYAKWKKEYFEYLRGDTKNKMYLLKHRYFVVINDEATQVKNRGSVLRAFKDQKKALKQSLKTTDLSFKDDFVEALIYSVRLYDKLKEEL